MCVTVYTGLTGTQLAVLMLAAVLVAPPTRARNSNNHRRHRCVHTCVHFACALRVAPGGFFFAVGVCVCVRVRRFMGTLVAVLTFAAVLVALPTRVRNSNLHSHRCVLTYMCACRMRSPCRVGFFFSFVCVCGCVCVRVRRFMGTLAVVLTFVAVLVALPTPGAQRSNHQSHNNRCVNVLTYHTHFFHASRCCRLLLPIEYAFFPVRALARSGVVKRVLVIACG